MQVNVSTQSVSLDKLGVSAALLTATGWGLAGIFIQLIQGVPALSIVAIRLAIALVVLVPLLIFIKPDFINDLKALRNPTVWGLGIILFACYTLGTIAFQMAPVGEATLLMTTAPLFVIIYKLLVSQKVVNSELVGALLAVIGIIVIILPNLDFDATMTNQRIVGDMLSIAVSVLFALNAIWFCSLVAKDSAPSTVSVTIMTLAIGTVMFLLFIPDLVKISARFNESSVIVALLFLSLVSTAVPTISYAVAARRLPAIMTTGLLLFEPILAIIFAFFVLSEVPSIWLVPGLLLVLTGLYYMGRGNKAST